MTSLKHEIVQQHNVHATVCAPLRMSGSLACLVSLYENVLIAAAEKSALTTGRVNYRIPSFNAEQSKVRDHSGDGPL